MKKLLRQDFILQLSRRRTHKHHKAQIYIITLEYFNKQTYVEGVLPPHASMVISGCLPTNTRPFDT